jgi:YD repeat-containing protein
MFRSPAHELGNPRASFDGTKIPYSYDANGNETGAGPWSYSYNLASQLTQATNGSLTAAYSYDGDGNRLTE